MKNVCIKILKNLEKFENNLRKILIKCSGKIIKEIRLYSENNLD